MLRRSTSPLRLLWLALVLAAGACSAAPPPPKPNCGRAPGDWCTSAADGPCGAHPDEAACRADDRCRGMPYRGESLVACVPDGKGFWSNCPAVGCVARTEAPGQVPGAK